MCKKFHKSQWVDFNPPSPPWWQCNRSRRSTRTNQSTDIACFLKVIVGLERWNCSDPSASKKRQRFETLMPVIWLPWSMVIIVGLARGSTVIK